MSPATIIEFLGFVTGVVYLYFEYHGNARMWIVGFIMPAISMWIYYNKGLYADFAINIYYFIIAVYGYIAWTFNFAEKEKKKLPVTCMPRKFYLPVACVTAAVYGVLCFWLVGFTDSNVPWYDAFTTAFSITGMWMLARKYLEQWAVWIAVDAICVGLYIYKGIYFYAALYLIYTVVAFYGLRKWRVIMQQEQ